MFSYSGTYGAMTRWQYRLGRGKATAASSHHKFQTYS